MTALWLAFKLWGGFGRIGGALAKFGRYLFAHPATAAAIVFALLWRVEAHEAAKWAHVAESRQKAFADAAAASEQAKQTAERISKENADAADRSHDAVASAGRAAVAAFIAARRVQPARAATPASSETGGAGVPENAAAVSIVAVPEQDVNTCDADYSYARSAYDWAQKEYGKP